MKNDYEVRAQKFIRQIFPYLEGLTDHDDRWYAVYSFNLDHHRKVSYSHGMSRYALITSDYVVKVDYKETPFGCCEDEIDLYAEAEADGYDYLFAKITRYTYQGMNFYIMPRIYGIERKPCDADYYMTPGEQDWCYNHALCDLHNENYGWKNGHIVIFDYAAHW